MAVNLITGKLIQVFLPLEIITCKTQIIQSQRNSLQLGLRTERPQKKPDQILEENNTPYLYLQL